MTDETRNDQTGDSSGSMDLSRRGLLKALVSVPFIGAFAYNFIRKKVRDDARRAAVMSELGVAETGGAPAYIPEAVSRPPSRRMKVGIIGYGGEGESLVRNAGFGHPEWVEDVRQAARENPANKAFEVYMQQEDLNIELAAVCDVFDVRAERAMAASAVETKPGNGPAGPRATRYRHYQDLLQSGDVEAVIIATPDHWHAQMTQDAAAEGIHVYCEKCMTRTEEEARAMYDAVTSSGIVFQLGHQNRQSEAHSKAAEVADAGLLGPITLVEGTTNRNSPWGAWVWDIHEEGSPETIDWDLFQGPAPNKVPFSLERFFRWRCWFDYGTGLSGDLLSHEYDGVNQILKLGIPKSAVASGGIYYFKDGRDVPDTFQAVYEYPDRELTFVYSATLANGNYRGLKFMGHDATMAVSGSLSVTADGESTRYKEKIERGFIDTSRPMFTYRPGSKGIDAVTSATEEYFVSRGLLYTYRGGRRVSAYHLLIKEWLDVIRGDIPGPTSCNIERGFEEAITCHMATKSFLEGRKVEWDPVRRRIV